MSRQLFRKKSMDKVSSPEQLNEYIRVSSPSVWLIMSAIIVLLVGACVWGFFGHLDTKLTALCQVKDGKVVCYVRESDIQSVKVGMNVEIQNQEYEITSIESEPVEVTVDMNSELTDTGNLQKGERLYLLTAGESPLKDGIYQADIILERVSPMSFVLN